MTTKPRALISWARFDDPLTPQSTSPEGQEIFQIFAAGFAGTAMLDGQHAGTSPSGYVLLDDPDSYNIEVDSNHKFAIEIYESSDPASNPDEPPPIPEMSEQERRAVTELWRIDQLEARDRERQGLAYSIASQAQAASKARQMRQQRFGGGGANTIEVR